MRTSLKSFLLASVVAKAYNSATNGKLKARESEVLANRRAPKKDCVIKEGSGGY